MRITLSLISQTSRNGLQRNRQALQRLSRDDNLMRLHAHLRLKRLDDDRIDALHGRHRRRCAHRGQRFLASEQFIADAHLVHAAHCGIAEGCVSEGLDSPRIRCVVVFHMRHLVLFFERYISRVPSRQYFRAKAMHHFMSVGRGQCRSIVSPTLRNHSPSLCPWSKVILDRAVIINGLTAHYHSIAILLDMCAWVPLSSRPGVGLPSIGDEAIVKKIFNQPVATISPCTSKPYHAGCAFKVRSDEWTIRVGVEIPITTEVESCVRWAAACEVNSIACLSIPHPSVKCLICCPPVAKTIIDRPCGIPIVIGYRRDATSQQCLCFPWCETLALRGCNRIQVVPREVAYVAAHELHARRLHAS